MKYLLILLALIGGFYYANGRMAEMAVRASDTKQIHGEKFRQLVKETENEAPAYGVVVAEIIRVFGQKGKEDALWAINCFYGESRWRYNAVNDTNSNGTWDVGVAQINDVHGMSVPDRMDYKKNIKKAYEIYLRRGKSAWYSPRCR